MNYTQTLRNYILERKGKFFEIALERKYRFKMIEAKTMMRILNRLEDERILTSVCKGLYFINDEIGYSKERLIEYFTSNSKGMVTGYYLYNKLGFTNHFEGDITIYTNAITGNNKHIDNIYLKKVNIYFFDEKITKIITALELLEYGFNNIVDCDVIKFINEFQKCLLEYNDFAFKEIVSNIKYSGSTILKLSEQLDRLGVQNKCIDIFHETKK